MADIAEFGSFFTKMMPSSVTVMNWMKYGLIFFGIILLGAVIFFIINLKKKQSRGDMHEIGWWEEINDQMVPLSVEKAQEIIIPGTSLRVFYLKKKDMWLPRFTRAIKPKLFWVVITPTKELVNWTPKPIGRDMKEAGINYDHTDMRWAAENTKEFIKRNYRDKATSWWKEYQGVITGAVYIMVVTFCLAIILYLWKGLVDQMGSLASQLTAQCQSNVDQGASAASGVIKVP